MSVVCCRGSGMEDVGRVVWKPLAAVFMDYGRLWFLVLLFHGISFFQVVVSRVL